MGDRATALQFYNQAVTALGDKDNPEHLKHSLQLFSSACMVDPTWDTAWFQVGNNHSELNHLLPAIAEWRRALQCNPDPSMRAKILSNLGWRLHQLGRQQEALEASEESTRLDPNLQYSWVHQSMIHQILGNTEQMLSTAARAYDLLPGDPVVELAYSFALLFGRKLADGFRHFECRFPYKLKNYLQFPYPKWLGEADKTVYIDADQGLGDTLSFARFIALAAKRARFVHLAVQPELMRLFLHAFVALPNVNIMPKPHPFPQADCWSTFVSLPFALGLTDEEIRNTPHISCPPTHLPINWKVPDRKLHVGIAWGGSPANDINVHRSIHVTQFYDLFKVPGVQLYALQVGPQRQDLYDNHGLALVRDLGPHINDAVDTVALLKDLDLVICCESALGHICALAGRECWLPYSWLGRDYRLGLDGSDMIWTPAHRVFRQGPDMKWEPVFNKIAVALQEKIDERRSQR